MPCSSLRFSVTAGALLLVLVPGLAVAQSPLTSVYAQSDSLLDAHVEAGEVDYAALAEHPRPLRSLVQDIEQVSLSSLPPPHAKAFLLNAYNLLAIRAVVEAYPISSPQDVPDFFTAPRVTLAGERRSLDAVENLLFERFPDPRLHFALARPSASLRTGMCRPELSGSSGLVLPGWGARPPARPDHAPNPARSLVCTGPPRRLDRGAVEDF